MATAPGEAGASDHEAATAALLDAVREVADDARAGATMPTVGLDSRLDADLGLDSLAVAQLLVLVEERFGITLPEQVLATVETPRDLLHELAGAAGRPLSGGDGHDPTGQAARPTSEASATSETSATPDDVPTDATTLLEVLDRHAAERPDRTHVRLLPGGEELTYGALRREAAAVASGLRQRQVPTGSAVAIMLPTGRDYFVAYFGALLAGCVPAPIYPPGRPSGLEDHLRRYVRVLDNAQAAALVTVPEARRLARLVAPQVPTLRCVSTVDDLAVAAGRAPRFTPGPGSTALLQYTSGSTGDPKGVVLTHANLLANVRAMRHAGELDPSDVFVSWLPLYHDMGLIGSWLLSLYVGIPFVVMSPLAFVTRPARWLRAIHDHGGTVSGGPNFGYELCLQRIDDAELEGLDLTGWRLAFNGAEPVGPDTVTRFAERFAPYGLRREAVTPVYGLAESAVAVTVPPVGRGPVIDRVAREPLARSAHAVPAADDDPDATRFVACGPPLRDHAVRIVGPDGAPLGEREEGRIQFRGPSATSGYFRNPDATSRLRRGDWLDSGDLGYLADGDLYPTGRVKDLIIRAGRNLHPAELEAAVAAIPDVRKGCVAAFATRHATTGTERLVVVAETRATGDAARARIRHDVNGVATEVVGTPPDEVVLAPPGAVPKTSSGKVRRTAARERYESGRLDASRPAVWWQVARLAVTSLRSAVGRAGPAAVEAAYGAYALAVIALAALVVWPAVVLLPGLRRRWRVVRRAGRLVLRLTGVRVSVAGAANLPADRPYVVAANHASFLDPLVLALLLPPPVVFAAVGGLADRPLVHLFVRRMGARMVARDDREQGLADTRALTEAARSGRIVAVFPEGRRSPAPGLEPFHLGAFVVAADAGVPVVPVALRGTRRILPVGRTRPRHGEVTVTVAPAVAPRGAGWAGAVELLRETRAEVLRHCGEPDLA